MKTAVISLVVGFLLAVVGVALGSGWISSGSNDPRALHLITVTGEARLVGEPDRARIMFGASRSGKTMSEAEQKMSKAMAKLIAAEAGMGVKKEEISTSDLGVNQGWYRWYGNSPGNNTVSHTITITTDNVQHVGRIIDTALANGMDRLQGVSYDVRDPKWREKALAEAVTNAQVKAKGIAQGLGKSLGPVVSVREGAERLASPEQDYSLRESYGPIGGFVDGRAPMTMGAGDRMPITRSLPGQSAMTVQVEVAYEI